MKTVIKISIILLLAITLPPCQSSEVKLRRFIRSLNPYQTAYTSKCIDFVKDVQEILVDSTESLRLEAFAHQVVMNWKNLRIVLERSNVVMKDIANNYFKVDPLPAFIQDEIHQTEILKVMKELLDIENNISYTSEPKYTLGQLNQCKKSSTRFANNVVGCPFAGDTQYYGPGGTCTDPSKPGVGASYRAYRHMTQPDCTFDCPECQGYSFPSAREASLTIADVKFNSLGIADLTNRTADKNNFPNTFTMGVMQLHIHDIMEQKFKGNEYGHRPLAACTNEERRPLSNMVKHPDTMCVKVGPSDYFYGSLNVSCLPVLKTHQLNEDCVVDPPGTMNARSPTLTLAPVYERLVNGSYVFNNDTNGKLLTDSNGLPQIFDGRSLQHITLTTAHYFFAYLHNKIVDSLTTLCPSVSGANKFLRARQLVIMFYQYIWFDDIMRVLIGQDVVNSKLHSNFSTYTSTVQPTILSEYACAAGRYPHVFIPDKVFLMDPDYKLTQSFLFSDTVENPTILVNDQWIKETARGTVSFPWNFELISEEIQSKMFANGLDHGSDLISMDIMRTRECCLKPYIHYLDIFQGKCITAWNDLRGIISNFGVDQLSWLFRQPRDLDLYTGASVEVNTDPEAKMPPTFKRITVEQYKLLKNADPKFWTRITTTAQRTMIKSLNFADLLCIAFDLKSIPKDAKMAWSEKNPLVPCRCNTFESCGFNMKTFFGSTKCN